METNEIPKISSWGKNFTIAMSLLPLAMVIWLLIIISGKNERDRYLIIAVLAGLLLISCLLIPYIIRVASIQLFVDSVRQTVLFKDGRFLVTIELEWQSIEKVSYKQLAYKLSGGGERIFIYLGCFSDYEKAVNFINGKLPKNALWI